MNSCSNALSTAGALVTSVGSGLISYNLYEASKDALIQKTAEICGPLLAATASERGEYVKAAFRILLPRAMPLTETAIKTICETAIRFNSYSQVAMIGTGLISVGALAYGLSGFLATAPKSKED